MVANTETRKKSDELLHIALEMLSLLTEKHSLSECEIGIIIFLMGDGAHYVSEAEHIRRKMKKDD